MTPKGSCGKTRVSELRKNSIQQQVLAGLRHDLAAENDVRLSGILVPMMADATYARHEEHSSRHDTGKDLRIVACTARHALEGVWGEHAGRIKKRVLHALVHTVRRALTDHLEGDGARTLPVG